MRNCEMVRRRWMGRCLAVITPVLATLALTVAPIAKASSVTPTSGVHQVGKTLNVWGVGAIKQGVGQVDLGGDLAPGVTHPVRGSLDLGPAAFNLPAAQRPGRATDTVLGADQASLVQAEAPTLDPHQPDSVKGGFAFLDQYREYRKDFSPRKQSVQVRLDQLLLEMVDANGPLTAAECPVAQRCNSMRSSVKVEVVAYKRNAQHPFFDVGGTIYAEGHEHDWLVTVGTSPVSVRPFWEGAEFDVNGDVDGNTTQSHLVVDDGFHPITITIPLDRVHFQHKFDVRVSLDAATVDDRGLESAAAARVATPNGVVQRGLASRLIRRVSPKLKVPPPAPRPAARCPSGPSRRAGRLQLGSEPVTVGEGSGTALVLVTRTGGSRGATSAVVRTSDGSARSGRDFTGTRTRVRFENGDRSPRIVEIPIREDRAVESPETFRVSLADPRCARLGQRHAATAMILDDDQPPAPPPPAFTIGGTVDGLQGSGLVLTNLGAEVPVSANGSFTFPGTAAGGQAYEVNVRTQPSNPSQICTVQNGTGHVISVNVTDIAVHCQTPAIASGLDPTFGDGGRVSTPVGGNGQGEGVVIQPSGQIVTAGWRTVGTGIDTDFALTRNNSDGTLDSSFGTAGIATTDLGGADDQAFDAALLPDNGIVAVGRTDALGILKTAFGVVRYLPDGTPNPNFGTGGIVTTPIFGKGAVANAVGVQPDGKIVVAGFATNASGVDSDFALVRYNPDGSLDTTFGTGGIVTTDLGTQDDDARAVAIQPDGKIVVVGNTSDNIALARYKPDGSLDPTFGSAGVTISALGTNVANGVALTSNGGIRIAGTRGGDFMVAGFDANGALDPTFGSGGVVTTDISGGDDFAEDLTVDAAGRIIVVGRATSSTILDMALARYTADGTLDTTFATNGIITADFHGRGEFGEDVAVDSQGRIVAAGYTANGADIEFALMRANP